MYTTGKSERSLSPARLCGALAHFVIYDRVLSRHCRWVLAQAPTKSTARSVLDIGCGNGSHLRRFAEIGWRAVGVDSDARAIEAVRTNGMEAIEGTSSHAVDHFGKESFDIITAFHVLEHVIDPRQFLNDVGNLLRPDGLFAGAVPVADGFFARALHSRWVAFTEAPRHIFVPSRCGLRMLLCTAFSDVVIHRESIINIAAVSALSILPRSTSSQARSSPLAQLFGGLLTVSLIPVVGALEIIRNRPSIVMFAATKRRNCL
ncbi:class I SAM-dependent methyltransferase [Thermopirellula anaerolimosa]